LTDPAVLEAADDVDFLFLEGDFFVAKVAPGGSLRFSVTGGLTCVPSLPFGLVCGFAGSGSSMDFIRIVLLLLFSYK